MQAKGSAPQSDSARWARTAQGRSGWDERNRMIAGYVPPRASVLDLGAGAQTLRDHLPPDCTYQPCDIVPGPGVLACDLDAGRWPDTGQRYDLAVCSGVLEYLHDAPAALAGIDAVARRAIVSYSDRRTGQRLATRVAQGWASHLSLAELRSALDSLDCEWRFLTEWHGHVILAIDFEAGLPPLRDGEALVTEAAWEASFAQLEALALRTGSAAVPASLVVGGIGLGAWVQSQRKLRRRGTLSARRARRLEALPGWTWRATRQPAAPAAPALRSERRGRPSRRVPDRGGDLRSRRVGGDRLEWMWKAAQGDDVLDIACGQGLAIVALARAGVRVTGFDRDVTALEQARARLSEENAETQARVTLVAGDPAALSGGDEGFDTVLLADVLEQAGDPGELLDHARRLLRSRGRVVVTNPFEAPRGDRGRPRSSLLELLAVLAPRLRPIEVVDGDRWVGIVAVEPGAERGSTAPWTALLEIAERRLDELDDAHAVQAARLEETRAREHELSTRGEALTAQVARLDQQSSERKDAIADLESRLAATGERSEELARALDEARAALATETARRVDAERSLAEERLRLDDAMRRHGEAERRLAQVREDGRALLHEAERHREQARALAGQLRESRLELAEHTGRAAESAGERRELREDARVQAARVAELQRELRDQRASLATRTTQLQTLRAGRAYRLARRWWKIRKAVRHPLNRSGDGVG